MALKFVNKTHDSLLKNLQIQQSDRINRSQWINANSKKKYNTYNEWTE